MDNTTKWQTHSVVDHIINSAAIQKCFNNPFVSPLYRQQSLFHVLSAYSVYNTVSDCFSFISSNVKTPLQVEILFLSRDLWFILYCHSSVCFSYIFLQFWRLKLIQDSHVSDYLQQDFVITIHLNPQLAETNSFCITGFLLEVVSKTLSRRNNTTR